MPRAVILARVSDPKQKIKGDSLDDQLIKTNKFIITQGWTKDREFTLIESGRKGERQYFWEVFTYCKTKSKTNEKIDYLVVLNIGRFTRGGGEDYLKLKREFGKIGVKVVDIYKTVGETVNTMADYGETYDWSEYSPSEPAEVYEANQRRDYVRAQLTQMIGGCIRNIRKGYWNGPAPFGLMDKKIETQEDGTRNILSENTDESNFIKRIYELRASGIADVDIVQKINSMGFKTRLMAKRDRRTGTKIGTRGGVPLTVKKIQEWVVNPIYCGVIVAKWTKYQPVKAIMYDGLVDIDTFNSANKGKIFISKKTDDSYIVSRNVKWANINQPDKRMRYNPLYPYKGVLVCPVCRKEVKASASTGHLGTKYPAYHCDRNHHKRWHEKREDVHKSVETFVNKLKFSPEFTKLFQEVFMESWQEKRGRAMVDSEMAENHVSELVVKRKSILETIKVTTSTAVREALEKDFEAIDSEIDSAKNERNKIESKELDIKQALRYAIYLVEHPKELLIDTDNMVNQRYLFGLVFDTLPTVDELVSGTAKLQPIFQLKGNGNLSKSDLVQRAGVEPTWDGFTDHCLTARLPLVINRCILSGWIQTFSDLLYKVDNMLLTEIKAIF